MSTYILNVHLDKKDSDSLKSNGYRLCIAKKVNNQYNVVWQGIDFSETNVITWTEQYQVFGQQAFVAGALVSPITKSVDIKSGQTALLDQFNQMHNATGTVDSSGSFHVTNENGKIGVGVNAIIGDVFAPVYVTTDAAAGTVTLSPVVAVLLWFDRDLKTGTMFDHAFTRVCEVDFSLKSTETVTYSIEGSAPGRGVWRIGENIVLAETYHLESNAFTIDQPSEKS